MELIGDGGNCALLPNTFSGKPVTGVRVPTDERLAERTRIAQELHDTLLQGFLAASMQLHVAVDQLSSDSNEKARLEGVARVMDRAIEEGRCVLQGLRPPDSSIRFRSLEDAFARVPRDLGLPSSAGFRVVIRGIEKKLKAGLLDEVYRIGREAIVNACRHSQAKNIEAEVEYGPTELRIAVRDNGRGMGPRDLPLERTGHWGVQGMRERAERIGARLHLWSSGAIGTEVELCVPGRIAFEKGDAR